MLSVTTVPQTTFWDKLVALTHDIETETCSNRLLATVRHTQNDIRRPDNTISREKLMQIIEEVVYSILLDLSSGQLPKFTLNKRGSDTNTKFTEGVGLQMLNNVKFHESL